MKFKFPKSYNKIIILIYNFIFLNILLKLKSKYDITYKNRNKNEIKDKKLKLVNEFIKIYSSLYDAARDGKAVIPSFSKDYKNQNYKYKKKLGGICICIIGKRENL